nr:hypothetical protein GCM10020241_61490 [Streptoalloteichus tenebrarius]
MACGSRPTSTPALLDALLAGDSDRARELMHEHLVYTHDVLTPDA